MPIFEFTCKACGHDFEALVRKGKAATCASCGSENLERHFSLPNVSSESTRAQSMRAARKRDQVQGRERVNEQINYEKSHDD
jgi:putative FmdB family regulatory protein